MKKLKLIATTAMLTLTAFGAVTLTSCGDDDTSCAAGYTGSDCKTKAQDLWVGSYNGNETCTTGSDQYTITVTAQSDVLRINLSNLYQNGLVAIGTFGSNPNTVTLSSANSSIAVSGTATLNGNTITVNYTINDGSSTNSCQYIGTK